MAAHAPPPPILIQPPPPPPPAPINEPPMTSLLEISSESIVNAPVRRVTRRGRDRRSGSRRHRKVGVGGKEVGSS